MSYSNSSSFEGRRSRSPRKLDCSPNGPSHKTLVARAIMSGDNDSLEYLLNAGSDVGEFSFFRGHGEPPLLTAVRYCRENMVTVLISHGADTNQASSHEHRPIHCASQRNYYGIMCQLLSHKADPNAIDPAGHTALLWAVKHRNMTAVKELLKYGADINLAAKKSSVLHMAVSMNSAEITKHLLDVGANVNAKDEFNETPLFGAIRTDSMEIAQALLDKGSEINTVNHDYRTPLHLSAASVHNNVDLTQLLLANGANINALDRYHNNPLALSLRNYSLQPNYAVSKCLMQHGSDLSNESCLGALEWTVEAYGDFNVIEFAVKAGYRLSGRQWVQDMLQIGPDSEHWVTVGHDKRKFVAFVKRTLLNAAPLSILCRTAIRERLISAGHGCSVYVTINKLPLPEVLKLFLMMEDDD